MLHRRIAFFGIEVAEKGQYHREKEADTRRLEGYFICLRALYIIDTWGTRA